MAMNNTVSANYLHLMQLQMNDGGCHYHLSANPGTIISENYCKGKGSGLSGTTWGEYADEGSAYLTIAKNVYAGLLLLRDRKLELVEQHRPSHLYEQLGRHDQRQPEPQWSGERGDG